MRMIDADALLKSAGIFEATMGARGCGKSILHLAKAWLFNEVNKAPTIDAVEVVRCKDCRYWDDDRRCNGIKNGLVLGYTAGDDFCSYGERKSDV
mgnify:CR=1 FL=1